MTPTRAAARPRIFAVFESGGTIGVVPCGPEGGGMVQSVGLPTTAAGLPSIRPGRSLRDDPVICGSARTPTRQPFDPFVALELEAELADLLGSLSASWDTKRWPRRNRTRSHRTLPLVHRLSAPRSRLSADEVEARRRVLVEAATNDERVVG